MRQLTGRCDAKAPACPECRCVPMPGEVFQSVDSDVAVVSCHCGHEFHFDGECRLPAMAIFLWHPGREGNTTLLALNEACWTHALLTSARLREDAPGPARRSGPPTSGCRPPGSQPATACFIWLLISSAGTATAL